MYNEVLCDVLAKNITHKKKSINRNCLKAISSDGKTCKIKKESMHEHSNIRK